MQAVLFVIGLTVYMYCLYVFQKEFISYLMHIKSLISLCGIWISTGHSILSVKIP